MYWHVFGPAWTNDEIDYQLDTIKKADIGGVSVYLFYPYALDDPEKGIVNRPFLSPEFLKAWDHAAAKAQQNGLRFGVNGGTGWPYGGPTVKGKDCAQRVFQKVIKPGADLKASLDLNAEETVYAVFQNGVDVTKDWRKGTLGNSVETRFYVTGPTGMQVKRASYGATGHVLTHFEKPALDRYIKQNIEPIVGRSQGLMQTLACDSLEVYGSNWTDNLPREFKQRCGYDLTPNLPELFSKQGPVRFDFWRTLAELTEEQFIRPLGDWTRKQGVALEMEAYGTPPNPMTSYRYIDIPQGEHYEWKGFSIQKYVSSAANFCKRPIISAEAWTWTGIPNRLIDSLGDLKLTSDLTFIAGANDLLGVDFSYSPRVAGSPGWLPYFGPVMNLNNPQWAYFPTLVSYINRCQWMLRQGKPVRNVALYLPVEDCFTFGSASGMSLASQLKGRLVTDRGTNEFGLKNALVHHSDVAHSLITHGFDYDGIDFWTMNRLAKVGPKKMTVGDGRYSAIVLPNLEFIDLDATRKIVAFCEAGGVVVATRRVPSKAPGKLGDSTAVRELMTKLFGTHNEPDKVRRIGQGSVIYVEKDSDVATALKLCLKPDVDYLSPQPTVGYVHRKTKQGEVYFFTNVGPESVRFSPEFAQKPKRVELWNAMTGSVEVVSQQRFEVSLPARGSIFVVLNHQTPNAQSFVARGREELQELNLHWKIDFNGPDAPDSVEADSLVSWTKLPVAKFFSGLASYRSSFSWEGSAAKRIYLRFEDIHEAAEVKVNGKSAGVLVVNPWEVDVTSLLQKGSNQLDVTVANLLVNRVIGLPEIDLKGLREKYGNQFKDPDEKKLMKEPAPSGLIGKVWLVVERG
jgi:hypothetical protein